MLTLRRTEKTDATLERLRTLVQSYPDFPKPGILFRDVSPLYENARAFQDTISVFRELLSGMKIDKVVSPEARGFLVGSPIAAAIGAGFVMVRKPGKLPGRVIEESYTLEYGSNVLQMHADAVQPGERVLIMDDLLATGGTVGAVTSLLRKMGADPVGALFLIELTDLGGRSYLEDRLNLECESLLAFPGH